jgi:hypothetical protein
VERVRGVAEHVNELINDLANALVFALLLALSNLPEKRVIGCISTYCYRGCTSQVQELLLCVSRRSCQ